MDGSANLHQATDDARDVLAVLRDALAYGEEQEIDDAELKTATLEGETDVFEMIDRALVDVATTEAHERSIADVIKTLQARKSRLKDRRDNIRTALAVTMEAIEEKKLQRPTATLSLPKARQGLEIDPSHEHEIPDEYLEVITPEPVVKILDKDIIDALKNGKAVVGCQLVELPRSVSIRSK